MVAATEMWAAVASDQKIHIGMTSSSKDKKTGGEEGFLTVWAQNTNRGATLSTPGSDALTLCSSCRPPTLLSDFFQWLWHLHVPASCSCACVLALKYRIFYCVSMSFTVFSLFRHNTGQAWSCEWMNQHHYYTLLMCTKGCYAKPLMSKKRVCFVKIGV